MSTTPPACLHCHLLLAIGQWHAEYPQETADRALLLLTKAFGEFLGIGMRTLNAEQARLLEEATIESIRLTAAKVRELGGDYMRKAH